MNNREVAHHSIEGTVRKRQHLGVRHKEAQARMSSTGELGHRRRDIYLPHERFPLVRTGIRDLLRGVCASRLDKVGEPTA